MRITLGLEIPVDGFPQGLRRELHIASEIAIISGTDSFCQIKISSFYYESCQHRDCFDGLANIHEIKCRGWRIEERGAARNSIKWLVNWLGKKVWRTQRFHSSLRQYWREQLEVGEHFDLAFNGWQYQPTDIAALCLPLIITSLYIILLLYHWYCMYSRWPFGPQKRAHDIQPCPWLLTPDSLDPTRPFSGPLTIAASATRHFQVLISSICWETRRVWLNSKIPYSRGWRDLHWDWEWELVWRCDGVRVGVWRHHHPRTMRYHHR